MESHEHQQPDPHPIPSTNTRSNRRDRRALLGAALGIVGASAAVMVPAVSARTTSVGATRPTGATGATGPTGARGSTGARGATGAVGSVVPRLIVQNSSRAVSSGMTGFNAVLTCLEPGTIAIGAGWKHLPPGWNPILNYNGTPDVAPGASMSLGFASYDTGAPDGHPPVEMQLYCLKATGVVN